MTVELVAALGELLVIGLVLWALCRGGKGMEE
jgi:hypothetical protein